MDEFTKSGRKKKIGFPGLKNELGEDRKIESLDELATHDPATHKPIKRKEFSDEALFFEMRAVEFDKKAADFRTKAEEVRKMGSVKDRVRAKKLLSMQKRMAELEAELKSQGIDTDALLSAAEEKVK